MNSHSLLFFTIRRDGVAMEFCSAQSLKRRALLKLCKATASTLPTAPLRCILPAWPLAQQLQHLDWCQQVLPTPHSLTSFGYLPLQQAQLASMLHPTFGPSLLGLVHASQSFDWQDVQQWPAGAIAIDSQWQAFRREGKAGTWLDCQQQVFDVASQQLLLKASSRYLTRQSWLQPLALANRVEPPTFADAPWSVMAQCTLRVSQGRRYAALSGDWNPIHLAHSVARWFGQPKALVHGAALVSLLESVMPTPLQHCRIQFLKPVHYDLPIEFGCCSPSHWQVRQANIPCITLAIAPAGSQDDPLV